MLDYLHHFIYGVYPYLAGAVLLLGLLVRFDYGQYTWKSDSSQMLSQRWLKIGSPLFHVGVLVILLGHFFGLLTPHWVYEPFISAGHKQILSMVVGGIAGVMCLVGGGILLIRRLGDPRVRASSGVMDVVILALLVLQVALGLLTIPFSMQHLDGVEMMKLVNWAQALVFFKGHADTYLEGVAAIYHIHIFTGLTIILLFPFTRLVHMVSAPVWYIGRNYQIVRKRG